MVTRRAKRRLSAALTGFIVLDFGAWVATGRGLLESVFGGPDSPVVAVIAEKVAPMPSWAFWAASGAIVLALSYAFARAMSPPRGAIG
jgi:hypothetical protein